MPGREQWAIYKKPDLKSKVIGDPRNKNAAILVKWVSPPLIPHINSKADVAGSSKKWVKTARRFTI
jgi:hypothetical protein